MHRIRTSFLVAVVAGIASAGVCRSSAQEAVLPIESPAAAALPAEPVPAAAESQSDVVIRELQARLADVESRLKKRDDADKKAADAAAKKFSVRPIGRLHVDMAFFNQDAANKATVGDAKNGVDIRRARFGFEGEGFDIFAYRFDVDFVTFDAATQRRPTIMDAFLDTRNLPIVGNVRIGHFREPFSLERLDSTHDLPFLERSAVVSTLTPFRNVGIMAFDWNEAETMTWSYGVFDENTNDFGEDQSDRAGYAFTGRGTWLPWYDELAQGRYLLHFGMSGSYRRINDRQRRFASTPEVFLKEDAVRTPNFVDTGIINLDHYGVYGFEACTVLGSLSLQGEYVMLFGEQTTGSGLFLQGGYVEAAYWLTGENRNYNRKQAIFGGVTPHSNFFRVRTDGGIATGPGAWEVAARYSAFDLNDRNVSGGRLHDVTLGLNWYYAVRCRVMFNYIHAFLDRAGRASDADVFAMRFQYAF